MTIDEFEQKFAARLTDQQREAVRTVDGPVLLLAVPGSGKTTVLVTRLGYMLYCRNIAPENILTLTYTVAATKDMRRRFVSLFGEEDASRLEFRTINGICAKIILYYGRLIGKKAFDLVTDEKRLAGLVSAIYRQVAHEFATENDLHLIRTQMTYIKNMLMSREELEAFAEKSDYPITEIYKLYCQELRRQGLMDYDDQMLYALTILKNSPETLEHFRRQFPYICLDEAQDTSKIQFQILYCLAGGRNNLFMVGDEDQSIYGFRAAFPQELLSFEERFPGARVLLMETNFRSDAWIVKAANTFIQKNKLRHKKQMVPSRDQGEQVHLVELKRRKMQYLYLARVARQPERETAVLYRDNESVIPLVNLLEKQQIPYNIKSAELGFFTHRLVLDITNILSFALHPEDTELFLKIYYKIGSYLNKETAQMICAKSAERSIPVLEAAVKYGHLNYRMENTCRDIARAFREMVRQKPDRAIQMILQDLGYQDYLERMSMKTNKIFILRALAREEETIEDFLERLQTLYQLISEKQPDPSCRFLLSTIHSSKGLEYEDVYLLDIEDGVFPDQVPERPEVMSPEEAAGFEEERRLFYVGVTRAREHLYLPDYHQQSVFLDEFLPERNHKKEQKGYTAYNTHPVYNLQKKQEVKPVYTQEEYEAYVASLGEGLVVQHKIFGEGVITNMSQTSVTILFGEEERKLMLKVLFEKQLLSIEM